MDDQEEVLQKINEGVYQLSGKRGKSAVWSLFAEVKKDDGSILDGFVYCRTCKHLLKFNGKQTSNLLRHKCFATSSEQVVKQQVSPEDREDAINACYQWVMEDCPPFLAPEGSGFAKLAQIFVKIGAKYGENVDLNPLIPDAKSILRRMDKMGIDKK